ncbi:hypothetical protein AUJ68_00050 [Candidatus Woesearchaeota archaeon CG1_02_57_44]|nr:MAG: hypothetical protein AUJ68_00050 [Candidatus Woesearchaeota archaeon CG1_02_57_44]
MGATDIAFPEREKILENIVTAMRAGVHAAVLRAVPKKYAGARQELLSIARARIRNTREGKLPEGFLFTEEDYRFATHQSVAAWRAQRLAGRHVLDCACGIGMQSIAFAATCKRVIANDLDARKVAYAKENAKTAARMAGDSAVLANIEFHTGDGYALAQKTKVDTVFCDPERAASEETRDASRTSPNVLALAAACPNLAVELPPQVRDMPIAGEREYLSLDGKLSRLTVYTGALAEDAASAVLLPSGHRIAGKPSSFSSMGKRQDARTHLCEVDPAVVRAGLISVAVAAAGSHAGIARAEIDKRTLLWSDAPLPAPVFTTYKVVASTDRDGLSAALRKAGAGSVLIRYAIAPGDYWKERKTLEAGLDGDKVIVIFCSEGKYHLCSAS